MFVLSGKVIPEPNQLMVSLPEVYDGHRHGGCQRCMRNCSGIGDDGRVVVGRVREMEPMFTKPVTVTGTVTGPAVALVSEPMVVTGAF
ncbi:MAG: hypothetical protein MZV63_56190 [Marinilabiliales bacterium]|nr:hypothetical protein [Marinilabiliales bacterium]